VPASRWSGASRSLRPAQDEEIAEFQQTCAQPLALVTRELRERASEERDLICLETHEDLALGGIARRREQRGRWKPERFAETCEHRGAWLRDATRLELGDRAARHADLLGELALRQMKTLAVGADQPSERGSWRESARRHVRKLTVCRHRDRRAHIATVYCHHMLHPIAARLLDHVELATPLEGAGYVAAVLLWLAGVTFVIVRKLRTSR
jgi:hypothetical protein